MRGRRRPRRPRARRGSPLYRSSQGPRGPPRRRKDGPATDRSGPVPRLAGGPGLCGVTDRRGCPEGGSMKRILLGLGCTLAAVPGVLAQDGTPAARLRAPAATLRRPATTVRAQAPDVTPAAAFDIPKPMPKGAVSETPGAPGTLPVPGTAGPTL